MLEDAEAGRSGEKGAGRMGAALVDHDHLARLHFPENFTLDEVQRARLGAEDVPSLDLAENERANPVRVPHPDQLVPGQEEK